MSQAISIIIGVFGFIFCVALLINSFVKKRKKFLEREKEKEKSGGAGPAAS